MSKQVHISLFWCEHILNDVKTTFITCLKDWRKQSWCMWETMFDLDIMSKHWTFKSRIKVLNMIFPLEFEILEICWLHSQNDTVLRNMTNIVKLKYFNKMKRLVSITEMLNQTILRYSHYMTKLTNQPLPTKHKVYWEPKWKEVCFVQYSQRHNVINYCDRDSPYLSDNDIFFALFNLFTQFLEIFGW